MLGMTQPADEYRRRAGLALGAVLGLVYGLAPQLMDLVFSPRVPLYRPPFGPLGNVAAATLGGALLGLLISWPRSGIGGTFLAALVSVVLLLVYNALAADGAASLSLFLSSFCVALPLWGLMVVIVAAVRWSASHLEETHRDRSPLQSRLWRPALLIVLVAAAALLPGYPPRARAMLRQTHELLQAGQRAGSAAALPASLATLAAPEGADFATLGQGPYRLSWESATIERYRFPRPARNLDQHAVVVARFVSGWNLVCLYIASDEPPVCRGLTTLPR